MLKTNASRKFNSKGVYMNVMSDATAASEGSFLKLP
jgi:hypothetical protein